MNTLARELKGASRSAVVLGVLTILLGLASLSMPLVSGLAVEVVLASVVTAAGVLRIVHAFRAEDFGAGLGRLLWGLLTLLAGLLLFARPMVGLMTLTVLVIAWFLADGATSTALALRLRPHRGWGWLLFHGLVSLVLGAMLLAGWPGTAVWAVGMLVGVQLLTTGLAVLGTGSAGIGLARQIEGAAKG